MATASALSESERQEISAIQGHRYVCPICLESAKTPRSLPCLHSFCDECSQTFISAAVGKSPEDVACPVCRKQIVAPEPELYSKSCYISTSLMDPNVSDENSTSENCRACERSHKVVSADHYCKDCMEAICHACKQLHNNFPTLKNHVIVTLEYFRNNPPIPETDEMCQHHPSKVVEVYCLDHRRMCCSVCFATQHRHCNNVKSIEECTEYLSEGIFHEITSTLESLLISVESVIKEKEELEGKLQKYRDGALVKMTQGIDVAKKNLDMLLQKFASEIDKEHLHDDTKRKEIIEIFQGMKSTVMGAKQMLKAANKYGSKTQIFILLEKMKEQIGERFQNISDFKSGSFTEDYMVDMKKVEEICGLDSLGSIHAVSASSAVAEATLNSLTDFTNASDFLGRERLLKTQPHMLKINEEWAFKLPNACYGATFHGGEIVVLVNKTKEIIVIEGDGSMSYKHSIPYSKEPADINSSGDENEVFISFKKQKILKKYHIDETGIEELSTKTFEGIVEGFLIFDDQIVHACEDSIFISNWNGELLQSIPARPQGNIAFLAGYPTIQNVFYHTDGTHICCRNLDEDTVTKISLAQCTNSPRGIGVDFQGNTYVCCHSHNRLLQISHKDDRVNVVLDVNCYTIAFNPDGMSFVLIDHSGNMRFYTISELQ